MNRVQVLNVSTMSQVVSRLRAGLKTVNLHSDNDPFCPPDYAQRHKLAVGWDATTSRQSLYMISPGALVHSWFNVRPELVRLWVEQLLGN